MSYFVIKNLSRNRPLVFTLKDGTTLRLFPMKETTISAKQYINHLNSLVDSGLIMIEEVESKKKKTTENSQVDEPENT